jgi:hypothetical protein
VRRSVVVSVQYSTSCEACAKKGIRSEEKR